MTAAALKQVWKKEYVQTIVMIVIIVVVVLGLWFGSQAVLGTQYPALAVASGSMCKVQRLYCDGWSHPFERTLHTGDLIIVKGMDPKEVHTGPEPEGDIIVFHKPKRSDSEPDDLIVHRAIENVTYKGLTYFRTKGDGNPTQDSWGDYRGENYTDSAGRISEKLLVGKVIMRIPWVGHLALMMRNFFGVYVIIALVILLIIVEFALPALKKKPIPPETGGNVEKASET
jgi:signal peptidase I